MTLYINRPASVIYQCMSKNLGFYHDNTLDAANLPKEKKHFLSLTYYQINRNGSALITQNELPLSFIEERGFPEAGYVYCFDVNKMLAAPACYGTLMTALEDDSFPLYKEYVAARKTLQELLGNLQPKGDDFFDDLE